MKILFFGTPRFAEIVLQGLLESKHNVVGVVCQNDKPSGRGNKMVSPRIVEKARQNGIAVYQFEKLREHIDDFKAIDCDIFVTASYGKILPKSLLEIRPCVNVHPSLLPKYRGATPIQSALLAGDEVTGVTIMKTEVGMDDGDIYVQEKMKIDDDDDFFSLHDKLADLGVKLLIETLDKIQNGTAKRTPQKHKEATFVKMIEKADAHLDFSKSVKTLVNEVRAYAESPVAFFFVGGARIKVQKARVFSSEQSVPIGTIIENKKHFLIQASDGVLEILRCQAEGGKMLDAASFLNGYRFASRQVDA